MPRRPRLLKPRSTTDGLSEFRDFRFPHGRTFRCRLYAGDAALLAGASEGVVPANVVVVDELGPVIRPVSSKFAFAPAPMPWWQLEWKTLCARAREGLIFERQPGDACQLRRLTPEEAVPTIFQNPNYVLKVELPAMADWTREQWSAGTRCLDDAHPLLGHLPGWTAEMEKLRAEGMFIKRTKRGRPKSNGSEHTLAILSQARCIRLNHPDITKIDAIEQSLALLGLSDKDIRRNEDGCDLVERYEREWNRFDIEGNRGPIFSF